MGPPRTPFSTAGLNLILDLPDDPKTWTPEDVARYLGRVVRSRTVSGGEAGSTMKSGNDSNESLASDLAAFVREKQIGGRGFMRMTEADLDGYVPSFSPIEIISSYRRSFRSNDAFYPSCLCS